MTSDAAGESCCGETVMAQCCQEAAANLSSFTRGQRLGPHHLPLPAFGGHESGWDQVSARLDWASAAIKAPKRVAEIVVTVVGDGLAYTVALEHTTPPHQLPGGDQDIALHPGCRRHVT